MKFRRWIGCAVFLASLLPAACFADGLIRDGVGPISGGRGGTNQAFADNAAILLDNPGALVNVEGNGLGEFGADTSVVQVQYNNPLSGSVSHVRPLPMPVLGYIRKSENGCWAWGIGAFVPAGFGAAYGQLQSPALGGLPANYRSIGGLGKILPGLSYKVNDRLSVGLTVGLAFSDIQITGPYVIQEAPLTGLPALLNMSGFGVAPTGSVGMQYKVSDRLMVGACYTSQSNMTLRGGANATLFAPGPFPPISSHFDSKIHMKWPQSVAFGLKYDLCEHRRVSADVIWYDWGGAFDQVDIQLNNPTNPVVPIALGLFGASLPVGDTLPLDWMNSVSMRLGYEWMPNTLDTWRFGYVYHGSPVPDSTLNPYLDGILTHAFSTGYSHKFERVTFNASYYFSFSPWRHVDNSAIVGGDFDDTNMRAQVHFAMFSLLVPF